MKGLERGALEGRVRGVVANKADLFGPPPTVGREAEDDVEEERREAREEGERKLGEVRAYVEEMERDEVSEGWRREDEGIWVVATSAKRRENVGALVRLLAETVKGERQRQRLAVEAEEREEEEERLAAKERLAGDRENNW